MSRTFPVSIRMDTYSGSAYVKAHAGIVGVDVHHKTMTAAMDRLAREVWGDSARSIRLTPCTYEFVWIGSMESIPAALQGRNRACVDTSITI